MKRLNQLSLTEAQETAYVWILEYVERHGEWPTFRQIADGLGYSSPNSVTQIFKALDKKGWIQKQGGTWDFVAAETMPPLTPQRKAAIKEHIAKLLNGRVDEKVVKNAIDEALYSVCHPKEQFMT